MLSLTDICIPFTFSAKEFIRGIYEDDFFVEDFFDEELIESFLEEFALAQYLAWKTRSDSTWRIKFYLLWSGELPDLHIFNKSYAKPFKRGEVRVVAEQKGFRCTLYKYNEKIIDGTYKISAIAPGRFQGTPWRNARAKDLLPGVQTKYNETTGDHTVTEINLEGFKLVPKKADGYLINSTSLDTWCSIAAGEIPHRELPTLINHPILREYALHVMKKENSPFKK